MPFSIKPFLDFSGGLNVDSSSDTLKDNELTVADNVDLDERGAVNKRGGTVRMNDVPYDEVPTQILEWVRANGTTRLLSVLGAKLCAVNDGTFSLEELCAVAGQTISFVDFQDKFYFLDGNAYRVYDGETVADVTPDEDAENDLEPVKKCKFIVRHPMSYRFFAAGNADDQSALYFSEPNAPGFFRETSKMYPATAEGPITALAVTGDAVIIFFKNGAYTWRGKDPMSDAAWTKIPIGQGTAAPRTIASTPSSLTFMGAGGLYALNPSIAGYNMVITPTEGMVNNLALNRVTGIINNIANPSACCAVYDIKRECYYLAYQGENSPGQNDRVLVYNWKLNAFSRYTGLFLNDICLRYNGDILAATFYNEGAVRKGAIIKLNTGYNDFGDRPIDFRIQTKQHQLDYPFFIKKVRALYVAFKHGAGSSAAMNIYVGVDSSRQLLSGNMLAEGGSYLVWGEEWGKLWGNDNLATRRGKLRGKGYRVQIEISNSALNQPFALLGIAVQFKPTRKKGMKFDA